MNRAAYCLPLLILFGTLPAIANAQSGVEEGKPAPATRGVDMRGQEFSLDDYRGKVVMVYFWGNWCGPCRAFNPHCHALAKHLPEDAFALIGVNSDRGEETIEKLNEQELINWRSFATGGPSRGIASEWGVKGWPSIVILDTEGKVKSINPQRQKGSTQNLNEVLADLLEDSSLMMGVEEAFEEIEVTTKQLNQKRASIGDR